MTRWRGGGGSPRILAASSPMPMWPRKPGGAGLKGANWNRVELMDTPSILATSQLASEIGSCSDLPCITSVQEAYTMEDNPMTEAGSSRDHVNIGHWFRNLECYLGAPLPNYLQCRQHEEGVNDLNGPTGVVQTEGNWSSPIQRPCLDSSCARRAVGHTGSRKGPISGWPEHTVDHRKRAKKLQTLALLNNC